MVLLLWWYMSLIFGGSYGYNVRRSLEAEHFSDDPRTDPSGPPSTNKRMYLVFVHNNGEHGAEATPLDSWSVVWYIASFGGLIIFFLIVSCSEWCCRRAVRRSAFRSNPATANSGAPDTPPPSYDQFAPPSYESICLGRSDGQGEKKEYDIYVVPVHTLQTLEAPPSYFSVRQEP